jgi:hypothetical protein
LINRNTNYDTKYLDAWLDVHIFSRAFYDVTNEIRISSNCDDIFHIDRPMDYDLRHNKGMEDNVEDMATMPRRDNSHQPF